MLIKLEANMLQHLKKKSSFSSFSIRFCKLLFMRGITRINKTNFTRVIRINYSDYIYDINKCFLPIIRNRAFFIQKKKNQGISQELSLFNLRNFSVPSQNGSAMHFVQRHEMVLLRQ